MFSTNSIDSIRNPFAVNRSVSPTSAYMIAHGTVTADLVPCETGRIQLQGVLWKAKLEEGNSQPIYAGEKVSILHREGLTLIVKRVPCKVKPLPRKEKIFAPTLTLFSTAA